MLQVKLSREEFFFNQTVKLDSKLFKIIEQQGVELDFRKLMDKYIRDFQDIEAYPLLEKYKNFMEAQEINRNEFIVPKFVMKSESIRKVFIEKHRELFRRQESELFELFENAVI